MFYCGSRCRLDLISKCLVYFSGGKHIYSTWNCKICSLVFGYNNLFLTICWIDKQYWCIGDKYFIVTMVNTTQLFKALGFAYFYCMFFIVASIFRVSHETKDNTFTFKLILWILLMIGFSNVFFSLSTKILSPIFYHNIYVNNQIMLIFHLMVWNKCWELKDYFLRFYVVPYLIYITSNSRFLFSLFS